MTLLAEPLGCARIGLDRPLDPSYGVVSPGLDQPPPRCGDGDRDSDILPGVPGIVGRGCETPLPGTPDVAPSAPTLCALSWKFRFGGVFAAESRRRLCVVEAEDVDVASLEI